MKILITGANGFIGRNLKKYFEKNGHFVNGLTRDTIDLLDSNKVKDFFHKSGPFDFVIHCATCGGLRTTEDDNSVISNNIKMFYNIADNKSRFGKLINIGSGAELDRRTHITSGKRSEHFFPTDPYGISKNVIARICQSMPKFYNIRAYGVFGSDELDSRFIKNNIKRAMAGEDIIIFSDRMMDYMYIDDLCKIVDSYIKGRGYSEIDASYPSGPLKLTEIAELILKITGSNSKVEVMHPNYQTSYYGDPCQFELDFIGLENGIRRVYESLKK